MSNDDDEYYIDDVVPNDNNLKKIAVIASNLVALRDKVEDLKTQLSVAEQEYNYVNEIELPELMQSVGLSQFTLSNGLKLKVNKVVYCKLNKTKVEEADQWLKENGHEGMVKHKFEIPIPASATPLQLAALNAAIQQLGYKYKDEKIIHPQTLNKWAREQSENNEVIPMEYFEVWRGYKTNIG